ncbi:hypothetical protein [Larkinella soli]|uniref:hypothetical protein n=1 Tax=Larkinella soli TaxID=1770527 RepID=UPI000FFCA49C|nr:hypothetical protein [Larkinella soli]
MNRPLVFANRLLQAGLLFVLLSACRPDREKADPVPDEKPQILEMHIDGIPDDRIRIDRTLNEITVDLPDRFGAALLRPSFRLTANARLMSRVGAGYEAGFDAIDLNATAENRYFIGAAPSGQAESVPAGTVTEYRLTLRSTGRLAIRLVPEPGFDTWKIGDPDGFLLSAENIYDGVPDMKLVLTPKDVPGAEPQVIESSAVAQYITDAGIRHTQYPVLLRVRVPEALALRPGRYALELQKAGGRSAVSPDLLQVRKGTVRLGTEPYSLLPARSVAGEEVGLSGINLFENAGTEIELKHFDGTTLRRRPTRFSPDGRQLTFRPGAGIPPGHYVIRVLENGLPASTCYRLAVTRTADQPYVIGFGNVNDRTFAASDGFCDPNNPMFIVRNAADGGVFQLTLHTKPIRTRDIRTILKLLPVGRSGPEIEMTFAVSVYTDAVLSDYTAQVRFPETIPPGLYRFRVAVTDAGTGQTLETERFERVIDIR